MGVGLYFCKTSQCSTCMYHVYPKPVINQCFSAEFSWGSQDRVVGKLWGPDLRVATVAWTYGDPCGRGAPPFTRDSRPGVTGGARGGGALDGVGSGGGWGFLLGAVAAGSLCVIFYICGGLPHN